MFQAQRSRTIRKRLAAMGAAVVLAVAGIGAWQAGTADAAACATAERGALAEAQRDLNAAGFWAGAADGQNGLLTRQATLAFQKYTLAPTTGCLDGRTAADIGVFPGRALPPVEAPANGATIDQTRQLLFFTSNGATRYVLNTSTGNQVPWTEGKYSGKATTPNGPHQVIFERDYLHSSSLGLGSMYRPKYFADGGIAVHGSPSIPAFAASHGCVRVSNRAMDMIWNEGLLNMGTPVVVFGDLAPR